MRIVILDHDYPEFLVWLYTRLPGLEKQPYEKQMRVRNDSLFGRADFYPSNLRKLGHEAWSIYVNNEFMQKAWARKHGASIEEVRPPHPAVREPLQRARRVGYKTPLRFLRPVLLPLLDWLGSPQVWAHDILAAQIKHYKPDVILNQNISLSTNLLREVKPHTRLLVGQHAASLPQIPDLGVYDLMVSSLPNFVDYFRQQGVSSELLRLGFEPGVLEKLGEAQQSRAVSFVGSLLKEHDSRRRWLEYVCQRIPVEVWGQGVDGLSEDSPIRGCYRGYAWGLEMYRILRSSGITLNDHQIEVAHSYANNMRLFEATGVGTLLITDWKENLQEMFEPSKEVVAYRSSEECVQLIQYYLEHDDEREPIARAGQQRTLREHTYHHRMQEFVHICGKYL